MLTFTPADYEAIGLSVKVAVTATLVATSMVPTKMDSFKPEEGDKMSKATKPTTHGTITPPRAMNMFLFV